MHFRLDFAASIPKDVAAPELNEDAWAHNSELTCIALSDGASESFDSKSWARLLVNRYTENHEVNPDWVTHVLRTYTSSIDFENLSWSAQSAFSRGSFATLLGLTTGENETDVDVLCVGDSLAVHVRNNEVINTFPFSTPEQFDSRPTLLSTVAPANSLWITPQFFTEATATWQVEPGDIIYAVTDAVGQWLLSATQATGVIPEEFEIIKSREDLERLVQGLRTTRQMKLDDSTVLRLIVEPSETQNAIPEH